ncbi:hypothetical protein cand_033900 [Cryptosporidium andersoni]|uniref:Uncharacterized protein n=1 Tax=Cryptosporidium andersoni TaxID=117008 RepID=A0A1J4MZ08_9CRYT|nr:hypothetical protein cand_033900 [Cryptosporidium andersoni]
MYENCWVILFVVFSSINSVYSARLDTAEKVTGYCKLYNVEDSCTDLAVHIQNPIKSGFSIDIKTKFFEESLNSKVKEISPTVIPIMKKFKSDTPFKSNKLQRNLYLRDSEYYINMNNNNFANYTTLDKIENNKTNNYTNDGYNLKELIEYFKIYNSTIDDHPLNLLDTNTSNNIDIFIATNKPNYILPFDILANPIHSKIYNIYKGAMIKLGKESMVNETQNIVAISIPDVSDISKLSELKTQVENLSRIPVEVDVNVSMNKYSNETFNIKEFNNSDIDLEKTTRYLKTEFNIKDKFTDRQKVDTDKSIRDEPVAVILSNQSIINKNMDKSLNLSSVGSFESDNNGIYSEDPTLSFYIMSLDNSVRYLLHLRRSNIKLINDVLNKKSPFISHKITGNKLPLLTQAVLLSSSIKSDGIIDASIRPYSTKDNQTQKIKVNKHNSSVVVDSICDFNIPQDFEFNYGDNVEIVLGQNSITLYATIKINGLHKLTNGTSIPSQLITTLAVSAIGVTDAILISICCGPDIPFPKYTILTLDQFHPMNLYQVPSYNVTHISQQSTLWSKILSVFTGRGETKEIGQIEEYI